MDGIQSPGSLALIAAAAVLAPLLAEFIRRPRIPGVLFEQLGLDTLLGAFAAGILLRLALSPEQREEVQPRLFAVGFGFLIPVFFIVSGMKFDIEGLVTSTDALMRVPFFLLLFLVVRGLPALFVYRRTLSRHARTSLAFLQATALPLVVVITEIGLETGRMKPVNATALVGAAMLSVLLYPLIGFAYANRYHDDPAFVPIATPDPTTSDPIALDPGLDDLF